MQNIILDQDERERPIQVPYRTYLIIIAILWTFQIAVIFRSNSSVEEPFYFTIALLLTIPFISLVLGLIIGIFPYKSLPYGERLIRGWAIANIGVLVILLIIQALAYLGERIGG